MSVSVFFQEYQVKSKCQFEIVNLVYDVYTNMRNSLFKMLMNANNLERKHIYYINIIGLINCHFYIWCKDEQKNIFLMIYQKPVFQTSTTAERTVWSS